MKNRGRFVIDPFGTMTKRRGFVIDAPALTTNLRRFVNNAPALMTNLCRFVNDPVRLNTKPGKITHVGPTKSSYWKIKKEEKKRKKHLTINKNCCGLKILKI
jgi:hypothetical protein